MPQPPFSKYLAAAVFALSAALSHALDYRSVAKHGVTFYDEPTTSGHPLFVASKGYPFEVVAHEGDWLHVRDQSGMLAWVAKQDAADQRTVIVRISRAEVHAAPDEQSKTLFAADKNVVFDLLEPSDGAWAKVRARGGAMGFIRITEVWGL